MELIPTKKVDTLYCSFCGKSQHEANKLIAGPSVFICNECVDLCADILDHIDKTPLPAHLHDEARTIHRLVADLGKKIGENYGREIYRRINVTVKLDETIPTSQDH